MEFIQLGLLMLLAVLLSSAIEPLLPRVSLPLVQIGVGILIALFLDLPADLDLDADLFLVLFIAPLLFDESRNADNRALWQNKKSILSLAIGLVVASVFAIGFMFNLLVPSVPLAAAFAAGAALGPTDAVAVASLGKDIRLSKRQKAQLSGEALLNDASGVVSFQFAIAAVTTGAFSVTKAGTTFAFEFIGGVVVGLALGAAYLVIKKIVKNSGTDNVTTHVLYELCLPFSVYLVSEIVHVSGILAVVAAGLLVTIFSISRPAYDSPVHQTPESTRLTIASDSVWEVFTFALNGLIFLTLGLILPDLTAPILGSIDIASPRAVWLASIVAAITATMYLLRFVWILVMDCLSNNKETGGRLSFTEDSVKNALVTTLAGAKGAVAVAIIFTVPTTISESGDAFPQRSLIVFVVCAVCVLSLLIANFVVPLLAPRDDDAGDEDTTEAEIAILENVIEHLRDVKTKENASAVAAVVRTYQHRLALLKAKGASQKHLRRLRLDLLDRQKACIEKAIAEETVDRRMGARYLSRVKVLSRRVQRQTREKRISTQQIRPLASTTTTFSRVARGIATPHRMRSNIEFKIEVEETAVHFLEGATRSKDPDRAEAAKALLAEHRPLLSALKQRKRSIDEAAGLLPEAQAVATAVSIKRTKTGKLKKVRPVNKPKTFIADMQAEALRVELEQIQIMRKKGRISSRAAKDMRQDVYLVQLGLSD